MLSRSLPLTKLFGITCFSKNMKNLLMWAHYANSHKGICLGFDINENTLHDFILNSDNINLMLKKVIYREDRPHIKIFNDSNSNFSKQFTEAILTKDTIWRYEEEYRLIAHNKNKNKDFPKILYYNPSFLKEFILGSQLPLNKFFELYNLVFKLLLKTNPNLKIGFCVPNINKFKINIKFITNISIFYSNCKNLLKIVQNKYPNDKLNDIPMHIILIFFPEITNKKLNNIPSEMYYDFHKIYTIYNCNNTIY